MNTEKGGLPVSNLTDQEQTCGQKSTCILEFEMIEKLLKFYHESGLIKDINKNQLALAEETLIWKLSNWSYLNPPSFQNPWKIPL